jgi:putative oligomerization/nucleic acid binding protein
VKGQLSARRILITEQPELRAPPSPFDTPVIRYTGQHGNQRGAEPHFLMDVRPTVGEPFRTEVDELPLMLSFRSPGFGQVVKLECDARRKKARFIRADPAISTKTAKQAMKIAYDAELHGPVAGMPGSPEEHVRSVGGVGDPSERLGRLKSLHEQGLLTDDEYETRRQRIIDTI